MKNPRILLYYGRNELKERKDEDISSYQVVKLSLYRPAQAKGSRRLRLPVFKTIDT
jgi:hypothetical protein